MLAAALYSGTLYLSSTSAQATVVEPLAGASTPAEVSSGAAMFAGTQPLPAHVRGHANPLPPAATRCVNCHATGAGSASFGPVLSPQYLLEPQARRGGPQSAFDNAGFCRLLRTGIDPSAIVVRSAMPVYRLSSRQCAALWAYLTQPPQSP